MKQLGTTAGPLVLATLAAPFLWTGCSSPEVSPKANDPVARETQEPLRSVSAVDGEIATPVAQPPQDPQGTIEEQARRFFAKQHLDAAQRLFDRGQYPEAMVEITNARRYAPNDKAVNDLNVKISAALGEVGPSQDEIARDAARQAELQRQAIEEQAKETLAAAHEAMDSGDFARASTKAEEVLTFIRYAPIGEWDQIQKDAAQLADTARQRLEQQRQQEREKQLREAQSQITQFETEAQQKVQNEINTQLRLGTEAFDKENYGLAIQYADRVLVQDPINEEAQHLRLAATKMSSDKANRDYLEEKRRRFRIWRNQLGEVKIPYTGVMTPPNAATFAENSERRTVRYSDESPEDMQAIADLRRAMGAKMISGEAPEEGAPKLEIEGLAQLIEIVRNNPPVANGRPAIVLSSFEVGGDLGEDIEFLPPLRFFNDIPLLDLVEIAMGQLNKNSLDTGETYGYQLRPGMLRFTKTGGDVEGGGEDAKLRTYQVRDLTFRLNQFIGPDIGKIRLPGGFDTDTTPAFGGIDIDRSESLITGEKLMEYITSTIAPGTWEGETYSITQGGDEESPSLLIVVHRPEVQTQVEEFLNNLRRYTSSMVTIQSKFLTISENFLQEIGVDFRGLGGEGKGLLANLDDITNGLEDRSSQGLDNNGQGLPIGAGQSPSSGIFFNDNSDGDIRGRTEHIFDNALGKKLNSFGGATVQFTLVDDTQLSVLFRAVEKFADFRVANSQSLSVFNTQRAYISVINQISYIQDFDVEVAQASFISDPVVGILQEGVVLDVRPVISHDRRYITLELRPTVANLRRPIPTFSTTLAGLTVPVVFQIPELQVSSANTTAVVPDGGSILIGGLKTIRNVERRSEVPWIARIPIIGFLGKREGISDEKENLMVVIKAFVTDVQDAMNDHLARNRR
ncbi:MAG: hypothetical protein H6834_16120 [Planctomycetes bacterium]|nr:hypothetical protein [Planctomycetota bacterium]